MARRIGIFTGGGDCPGLNAAIRGVVRKAASSGMQILGFRDGWRGVMDGDVRELTADSVGGILPRGGTILGSSGANPYHEGGIDRVRSNVRDLGLDAVVAIGGEGTLGAAARLAEEGLPIVGIPKTIDNDLQGTDYCIGFHTAVQVATDAIDRLHSTAESHDRLMLVEVMGRSAGWIALSAGLAGGADVILIPERPFEIEQIALHVRRRRMRGHTFSIVVVAEGATPVPGTMELPEYPLDERGFPRFGGLAQVLAPRLEDATGNETRVTVLGHVQRGGTPSAEDRLLASRFGVAAVELIEAAGWGRMVAVRGNEMTDVPLSEAAKVRQVPEELYRIAEVFFEG
ncbi:MAG TPA: ATP-dependent 6-phosphofructokinase [Actinomycetota bacterium]|jgi:6-phosphofructokinase 1|nr:ATP-dependent 6-phosphofructokinase [Actinomycetota bacterium]